MKLVLAALLSLSALSAFAEDKVKMYYNNEEIVKIIEAYSKASGQKFVIDPSVRGKVSIFVQEPVSLDEAFNHLSSALAVNGYGFSKQGDTMVVKAARHLQRDRIEVGTERPDIKPERMYTWIYTVKNVPAEYVVRELRILASRDGEIAVNAKTNQLVLTDWASNLNRVADILSKIDQQPDPAVSKMIEENEKAREQKNSEKSKK